MFQIFPNNLLYKRYISDRFKTFFDQSIAKELVNIQSKYCFFEPQEKWCKYDFILIKVGFNKIAVLKPPVMFSYFLWKKERKNPTKLSLSCLLI